ncbi:GNAT family N-acetyltransferase [Vibrio lamellibrachiae]|uniref:tRNA(Met) cytidine acetyltransferase TmcA n=1 Tax=Vibrio lamellibrachiae TaxID=2910253 RepID=UPI003D14BB55
MSSSITFLSQLSSIAKHNNARFGVVLRGEKSWKTKTVEGVIEANKSNTIFQLGGESLPHTKRVSFKQGKQLLGQECQVLVCDFSDGFDANSFSAAIGTLVGGGTLIILYFDQVSDDIEPSLDSQNLDRKWLEQGLQKLINIQQGDHLPSLPVKEGCENEVGYREQEQAIEKTIHVVEGHRKRPLVLTADRGRGKTSALGLASATLMKSRSLTIIITAPSLATVAPLFKHAAESLSLTSLPNCSVLDYADEHVTSTLRFVAPDEVIKTKIECDLLIVDEAAAIPIPMLKAYVESYHRLVLSSTIHGYEGSGRGFSLKFIPWLKLQRANSVDTHLRQPIRWKENDPLERWHNQTFLLDAEFEEGRSVESLDASSLVLTKLSKQELISHPEQLKRCFALLVNAHYQTSPNDLFHLLSDDQTELYATIWNGECVGCLLTVEEGGLSDDIITLVQQGKRRPSGQLVSVTLANQLGIAKAAKDKSIRVMRIAVHPDFQGKGIGSSMLGQLQDLNTEHYLSTSFGATSELIHFWRQNGFVSVKLGSQRDKASGCYSVIMIKSDRVDWLELAEAAFCANLEYRITDSLIDMEIDALRAILEGAQLSTVDLSDQEISQLSNYVLGGTSFDSVAYLIRRLLMESLRQVSDSLQKNNASLVSDLLISKVLQQKSWAECSPLVSATGRKQCESQLRLDTENLMTNLHCKTSDRC